MDRRRFLKHLVWASGSTLLPLLPGCSSSEAPGDSLSGQPGLPPLSRGSFEHGVASGDPLANRVILWTRVTPEGAGPVVLRYQIARDPEFKDLAGQATVQTHADRDYTVKVDPEGLEAGRYYWYRFETASGFSAIGRTKTLPIGSVDRLRIAFTSCSNYPAGYFCAYRHMAERQDLDAVLHLGDYLYEGGGTGHDGRDHSRGAEIITLEDYRARHAQYRQDADLSAMTRQHPLIAVWDDHESTNDSWYGGAQNHTEGDEGDWFDRKAVSIQAYFEWMPIRVADPSDTQRIWRQFVFGDLVDLLMLDTRLYGRDEPLSTPPLNPMSLNDPSRHILGPAQESWLSERLQNSIARWKLLGQQVMMGQLRLASLPDISLLGTELAAELLALNADQWDGYPAARDRVFDAVEAGPVDNLVVLTGDIHSSWGVELYRDPGELVTLLDNIVGDPVGLGLIKALGVEFVTPSVTSGGFPAATTPILQTAFRVVDPHIKYFDGERHGYVLLDITHERCQGEWWYVDSITDAIAGQQFGTALYSNAGENRMRSASEPSTPRENPPPFAP